MFAVDLDRCTGCADCIDICPLGAISMKNEQAVINVDECAECGACMNACPNEAIFEKELESGIEERVIDSGINIFSRDKNLSEELDLGYRLNTKGDDFRSHQNLPSSFSSISRDQPRRGENRKGRCHRGS